MATAYRAFISYSHRDEAFARWLHLQIEGWRVPRELVGRDTALGKVPANLRPVFRDRDDFSGGSSLRHATLEALRASEALVVVCSPDAARSAYVDEEIRLFKMLGRSARIVPIIAAGTPGGGDDECFPRWLRLDPGADGMPAGDPVEPIAADARDVGDGRRRAAAKVVAGLLGVPFDEIVRRQEQARRSRNALLAGAGFGAFVFATAFSSYALYQSYQAGVVIDRSVFSIGGLVQSTDRLPEEGDIGELRRGMIREQCDLLDGLAGESSRIGVQEAGICFFERTFGSSANDPPERLLARLCAWRDGLEAAVMPKEAPGYDDSVALVQAMDRTYRQIALHPQAAGRCRPVDAGGLDGHLAYLLDRLVLLGRKRPDLVGLREVHEQATWELIGRRETAGDWAGSAALMRSAVDLRRLQMADPSSEPLHPAAFQLGVYLRRLGWLELSHLSDPAAAETLAREAVDQWEALAADHADRDDVAFQLLVAYEVHGNALVALDRAAEGRDRLEQAVRSADALLARLPADGAGDLRGQVASELDYLERRLAELGGA